MPNVHAAVTAWVPKHLRLLALVAVILGVVTGLFAYQNPGRACGFGKSYEYTQVRYESFSIKSAVANTGQLRQLGLGNRSCMPQDEAMLFVFDDPEMYGFWMKDMHFSIDILWLDAGKRVVTEKQEVSPTTYPASFYPDKPALYVLELPSGLAEHYGIREGSQLNW